MDEPKPLSFAAAATARLARFISYREVIEKLAAAYGDNFSDVAASLKAEGLTLSTACVTGAEPAVRYSKDSLNVVTLLDATIRDGTIERALPEAALRDSPADPDADGWMRESFIGDLLNSGLPCPDSLSEPPPYKPGRHNQHRSANRPTKATTICARSGGL
jgi:hypothetical protein